MYTIGRRRQLYIKIDKSFRTNLNKPVNKELMFQMSLSAKIIANIDMEANQKRGDDERMIE